MVALLAVVELLRTTLFTRRQRRQLDETTLFSLMKIRRSVRNGVLGATNRKRAVHPKRLCSCVSDGCQPDDHESFVGAKNLSVHAVTTIKESGQRPDRGICPVQSCLFEQDG
jgi:hypothetical protein